MNTTTVPVSGMSCGHCARAVETQVLGVADVTAADVDLAAGQVTITSNAPVDRDAVRVAVETAGYRLGS